MRPRRPWLGPALGYGLAAIAGAVLVWIALGIGTSFRINILILLTSGVIGWIVGILITPTTRNERTQFSEYGKALSTFVTGFLLAKVDKVFELTVTKAGDVNEVLLGQLMLSASAFALGILLTFIWRKYISPRF
jgi:hypothetical protein